MSGSRRVDPRRIVAACHVHSDWSYDGKWSLPSLASAMGRRGYRVLMMTEHDRGFTEARRQAHAEACAAASSSEVLVLPGLEYSDAANTVHVLVWGPVPFLGEGRPTTDLLKAVKDAQGVAVFAHPARRQAWKAFRPPWTDDLLGMEMWNRKTDGWAPSRSAPGLMQGTALVPFVGLDFHDRRQFFPLAMELVITSALDDASVLECLRARRVRALAFRRDLGQVMSGWRRVVLNAAERFRRRAAAVYRGCRPWTGATP